MTPDFGWFYGEYPVEWVTRLAASDRQRAKSWPPKPVRGHDADAGHPDDRLDQRVTAYAALVRA